MTSTNGDDRYSLFQIERDGQVRWCWLLGQISKESIRRFPKQFVIEWKLRDCMASGLPTPDELDAVIQFEEMVVQPLQANGASILALISMGNGYRELYFYCKDPLVLAAKLNEVLEGRDFPIEINAGHDPKWNAYEHFKLMYRT